eukprot:CAMPEP_0173138200 /NCGR_PEP_ID=MMETSP1105-20130129/3549_1 /TAXON_ID=2985 /ORGANISM="Ochromonas sp., Strain BG-1" /LENGTH=682 /DNA_ID=CAMNT_0014050751 /DNA_START=31 /DNA_END=2079 /DNA_ORIENTATION=+
MTNANEIAETKAAAVADKCTSIIVGAKASATGSPMTTHTADCADCDWRANKVPARDWPEGSMRPVYQYKGPYPRQVREDRGETWKADNLEDLPQKPLWKEHNVIVGYLPQVPHTYALIEGSYGIMNEHGLAIGESTCAAKFWAAPISAGGQALLDIGELSQIALERTKTAREAIRLMGELAEKYGYYSAGWDIATYGVDYGMGEGGEALSVIDKEEAWMFHILPDDEGTGAIWVAQRVPEDHVSAVANSFVIREVIPNHPDFIYSSNLWSIAEAHGWWRHEDGLLHFAKTYSPIRLHPSYANRRVWRVLTLAAPDSNLPGDTTPYADDYPFSIKLTRSDGPFTPKDIMWMQRDHYEGTPYSTTEGLAAGPYGDPNRWDYGSNGNMTLLEAKQGEFQRTISLFRTSYSFVATPRKGVDDVFQRMWLSQYAPDSSTYTPIYISAKDISKAWRHGTMHKYDPTSAWWNFAVVGNYAGRFYMFAMESVRDLQHRLESELIPAADALEASLTTTTTTPVAEKKEEIVNALTTFTVEKGDYVSNEWKNLFPVLLTTYRDGYIVGGQDKETIEIKRFFYPRWWLQTVGFFDHPGNKEGILFAPAPGSVSGKGGVVVGSNDVASNVMTVMITGLLFFVLGYFFALSKKKASGNKKSTSEVLSSLYSSATSSAPSSYQYTAIPDHETTELA